MNYSIDKMLNIIPSKYQIVYIASQRAVERNRVRAAVIEVRYRESKKNLDRSLE